MPKAEPIFPEWDSSFSRDWGRSVLNIKHRLHEDPLFSDDALADLIDRYPHEHYDLVFMGAQGARHLWREGEKGDLSGKQVIDAIRGGRFWINLRKVMNVDSRYQDLLQVIFAELANRVPSLNRTYKHNLGVLISSPNAQVYYHCDVPGQSLWQIRGSKRVFCYPPTEHYMSQKSVEGVILGETQEEIPYDPSFDEAATVVDLEPGQMLSWPLNGPHRVMNHDNLNISVTTEHWTDQIRNSYASHYANGYLRRRLGMNGLKHQTSGPAIYPKLAIAGMVKALGLHRTRKIRLEVDFRIDPDAPQGFVDIESYLKPA